MSEFSSSKSSGLTRRRFLTLSCATFTAVPLASAWSLPAAAAPDRQLSLVHAHTGESLSAITYFKDGEYVPDALTKFSHLLRDFRNGAARAIDPGLFDILFDLQVLADRDAPYEILSGYRSPVTNQMLHARSEGVAVHSLHLVGKAIDVRLGGFSCKKLQKLAVEMRRGGVGYYGASRFVHLDTGRVRSW